MASQGELIIQAAERHGLNPVIVAAVVLQESGGNPWAQKTELKFFAKNLSWRTRAQLSGHVPPRCDLVTEKMSRATSWGLMQVLGETARVLGCDYRFLGELQRPEASIEFGCQYLRRCLDRRKSEYAAALLAYNGGGNANYPVEVLARVARGEHHKILAA